MLRAHHYSIRQLRHLSGGRLSLSTIIQPSLSFTCLLLTACLFFHPRVLGRVERVASQLNGELLTFFKSDSAQAHFISAPIALFILAFESSVALSSSDDQPIRHFSDRFQLIFA